MRGGYLGMSMNVAAREWPYQCISNKVPNHANEMTTNSEQAGREGVCTQKGCSV